MAEDLQPIFSGDESPGRPPSFLRRLFFLWIPVIIIATWLICAVFAPFLAPHDPKVISILDRRIAPFENANFPLGSDTLGRDMLSRLIYGARTSFLICLCGLAVSGFIGLIPGLIAGYRGGSVDRFVVWVTTPSVPFIAVRFSFFFFFVFPIPIIIGSSTWGLIPAVAIMFWPWFARTIRDDIRNINQPDREPSDDFPGQPSPGNSLLLIWPIILKSIFLTITIQSGNAILLESFLTFLGLGLPPGDSAWGIMVAEGRSIFLRAWWLALFPGLAIAITVIALKLFGRWIRENPSSTTAA